MQSPPIIDWGAPVQSVMSSMVSHTIVNPREHANMGLAVDNDVGYAMGPGKRAFVDGPGLLNLYDKV